ncbi:hypothetical protein [Desertivirga brevis]|uniref:hypothetical protein n=1 Tax=Desertivirga brevis TaxID=2810310 RepID=UPI001A95896C|nr:hypothetical protein [Pedobacter sp. SYSU D00873]
MTIQSTGVNLKSDGDNLGIGRQLIPEIITPNVANMKKAVIVAFDKFTDIDIFLAWDSLNRVKFRDRDLQVKIVGTEKSPKSACGLDLATHGPVRMQ